MKTMMLETEVTSDGYVRLDVPVGFPPGKIQLVLVFEEPMPVVPVESPFANGVKNAQHALANEIVELLRPLKGMTQSELKEGRIDCEHRR